MIITIIATLMIMAGYFLLLYGVVGFIQDKKFFSSAPKENLAVIPEKKREISWRSYYRRIYNCYCISVIYWSDYSWDMGWCKKRF